MKPTLPEPEFWSQEHFGLGDVATHIGYTAETVQRLIDEAYAAGLEDAEKVCDEQYYKHIGPAYGEVRYGITACSANIRSLKPKGEA